MKLSKRMLESLQHLKEKRYLAVGNWRLQKRDSYVPSNTARALHDRDLVVWFFNQAGTIPMVALSEKGKKLLADNEPLREGVHYYVVGDLT